VAELVAELTAEPTAEPTAELMVVLEQKALLKVPPKLMMALR